MFRSIIGRYSRHYGSSRLTGSAPRPTQATLCQTRSLASPPDSYPEYLEQHHDQYQNHQQRSPGYHRDKEKLSRFHVRSTTLSTVSVSPGDRGKEAHRTVPKELENEFFSIVRDGQPDLVMNALLDSKFEVVVGSLPDSTFVEVFHLLSPAYFIDPFRAIHRALHPSAVALKGYRQLDSIFDVFACNLASIVSIRRSAGHRLGLAEYTHLLDCARSTGDSLMADHVWHAMIQDDVVPDVHCYNYYMEAKIWNGAYTGREKYRLRVTPFSYRKRRFDDPGLGWTGYGTGSRSVRKEVMNIFNEMVEEGTSGDEATYVNVIMANGRVGRVPKMKHVLKTVWNVDMDALAAQGDPSTLPRPTEYDRSSPLYPSSRLLFAIAHGFGTNSDIPGAMRAISFISSSYDIPVPGEVWQELLERSYVLSRPRFGEDAGPNELGKVPYEFVTAMFQTMMSEPFHVQPTMEMYQILAKTAWDEEKLPDFMQYMESAYAILEETRRKRRTARAIVENYLGPPLLEPQETRKNAPQRIGDLCQKQGVRHLSATLEYNVAKLRREAKLLRLCAKNGIKNAHFVPLKLLQSRAFTDAEWRRGAKLLRFCAKKGIKFKTAHDVRAIPRELLLSRPFTHAELRDGAKLLRLCAKNGIKFETAHDAHVVPHKLLLSRAFTDAVHAYDVLRIRTAQQTIIMERLARLLLIHPRWVGRDNSTWGVQLLPRAIEEWQDFLPDSVSFQITAGDVQFHGETHWGDSLLNTHKRVPVRRPTVDNGLVLDEEARELDDDFFWMCYPPELRDTDTNHIPALHRLFEGVEKRLINPEREGLGPEDAVEADTVEEPVGALPHAAEAKPSKRQAKPSKRQAKPSKGRAKPSKRQARPSKRRIWGTADGEDVFDPPTNPLIAV